MTQDEIIDMAMNSGLPSKEAAQQQLWWLESFAKLIAAKATDEANARSNTSWTLMCKKMVEDEREACAKVCDDIDVEYEGEDVLATWCSRAIRARGMLKTTYKLFQD
jgi:hypothetical protein